MFWQQNLGVNGIKVHYGGCRNDKLQYNRVNDGVKEKDFLFYYDYEGYSASLEIGENFGCIHFKERKGVRVIRKNNVINDKSSINNELLEACRVAYNYLNQCCPEDREQWKEVESAIAKAESK